MSNVIKKVFNTDKAEGEAHKAQDAVQGAENNAQHPGEGFLSEGKEKLSHMMPHHHHHQASTPSVQGVESNVVGQASAGVPDAESLRAANVSAVPKSESDAFGRSGNMTQTTSVNSGVNVAAGNVDQDVQHLAPVTRHVHHRHEIEELLREREHHIHQHHIQHHVQPVLESEHLAEQIHSRVVPTTTIREVHANTDKDAALMRAVAGNPKDTFTQAATDRSVIDKGETVREIVHHHIHNIVQPIIEKETHEYHRIRTTIPTTHITHEAPIVHESTAHQPIRKEDFIKGGGVLSSTTRSIEEAGLLNLGTNQRSVEGEAYNGGAPLVQ